MKFLVIYTPDTASQTASQTPERGEAMVAYSKQQAELGTLLSQAMFDSTVTHVQQHEGVADVAERQERVTGYAFLEAPTRSDAVELTKEFLTVAGDGDCEVRGVLDGAPQRHQHSDGMHK